MDDLGTSAFEIIEDFPGRFSVDKDNLTHLLNEVLQSLRKSREGEIVSTSVWALLDNGSMFSRTSIEEIQSLQNSGTRKIRLLVIIVSIANETSTVDDRVIAQFSRGQPTKFLDSHVKFGGEQFYLPYSGTNLRLKINNLENPQQILTALEEQFSKFRPWYSRISYHIDYFVLRLSQSLFPIVYFYILFSVFVYLLSGVTPFFELTDFPQPQSFVEIIRFTAYSLFVGSFAMIFLFWSLKSIAWMIPPSYIAIGDEIKDYDKQMKRRDFILIIVVLGIVISVIGAYVYDYLRNVGMSR